MEKVELLKEGRERVLSIMNIIVLSKDRLLELKSLTSIDREVKRGESINELYNGSWLIGSEEREVKIEVEDYKDDIIGRDIMWERVR